MKIKPKIFCSLKNSYDYLFFAMLVMAVMAVLVTLITWFLYVNNLKHWKRKSDTASHRITQSFQERLQETTLIMTHLGKKIMADGAQDVQKIEEHIKSADLNSARSNPLFTWVFLDWVDTTNHMRVNGASGIFEDPPDMSHREFTKLCSKMPWTLQVCKPDIGIPSGVWLIPIGLGVEGENNEYLGTVTGGLQIKSLREIFHSEVGSDEIDFLLIDDAMNIIVQSADLNVSEKFLYKKKEIGPSFFNQLDHNLSDPITYNDIKFYGYKKIKNYPYMILTGCNKKIIHAELFRQLMPHFLGIFCIGVFCLLLLYVFWKKIVGSIIYFSNIVSKISNGQLEIEIPKQKSVEMNSFVRNIHGVISYIKALENGREQFEQAYGDLSEKHKEVSYTLDLLKNYDQEKERFMTHLYQDLQSTLFIILSYSRALLKNLRGELDFGISEEKQLEFLNSIISIIYDLQKSITPVLHPSNVNIKATLESVLNIRFKEAFLKKITLQCSIDPSLTDIRLDEFKFMQIVTSLLTRAIEYTPMEGKVDVIAQVETVKDQKFLKITIQDNGFGLHEKDIERLFEKFNENVSRIPEPSRLDLPTIEKLIQMHQGSLSVQNFWKRGTTVKIVFPYTAICKDAKYSLLQLKFT